MKEYLSEIIKKSKNPVKALNNIREYLQARILGCLQHSGAMIPLAFHGGTALRFLYSIARYSEDLDFALEQMPGQYNFHKYLNKIRSELIAEGYALEIKVNDNKTVNSAFVKFRGLLYEFGMSSIPDEVFSIRIEVDTNPPHGAALSTTIIHRHLTLQLQHHDKSSLLAGKLHAILERPYAKGRDIYDLLWYLSNPNWPPPNITLLRNALKQTGWLGTYPTTENWRQVIGKRLQNLNWKHVVSDAKPFLENQEDTNLLKRENLLQLINRK